MELVIAEIDKARDLYDHIDRFKIAINVTILQFFRQGKSRIFALSELKLKKGCSVETSRDH